MVHTPLLFRVAVVVLVSAAPLISVGCAPLLVLVPREIPTHERAGVIVVGPYSAEDADAILREIERYRTWQQTNRVMRIAPPATEAEAFRWRQTETLSADVAEVAVKRIGSPAPDDVPDETYHVVRDGGTGWTVSWVGVLQDYWPAEFAPPTTAIPARQ